MISLMIRQNFVFEGLGRELDLHKVPNGLQALRNITLFLRRSF